MCRVYRILPSQMLFQHHHVSLLREINFGIFTSHRCGVYPVLSSLVSYVFLLVWHLLAILFYTRFGVFRIVKSFLSKTKVNFCNLWMSFVHVRCWRTFLSVATLNEYLMFAENCRTTASQSARVGGQHRFIQCYCNTL